MRLKLEMKNILYGLGGERTAHIGKVLHVLLCSLGVVNVGSWVNRSLKLLVGPQQVASI